LDEIKALSPHSSGRYDRPDAAHSISPTLEDEDEGEDEDSLPRSLKGSEA
jgi:hypothetical protein